jgi:putative hydrolase of the HAD superfamily
MVYRPIPEMLRSSFSHELPALIFDLGGVLLDWRPRDFVLDLPDKSPIDACHVDMGSHVDRLMGIVFQDYGENSDWVAFDLNRIDLKALVTGIAERSRTADFEIPSSTVQQWVESLGDRLQVLEPSLVWLKELKRDGFPLFYLSNMPRLFIPHITKHRRLFDLFIDGMFSGDVNLAKPSHAMFSLAQARFFSQTQVTADSLNTNKLSKVVFFDDHPLNVQSAQAFGWTAIRFENVEQARHAFINHHKHEKRCDNSAEE